MEKIKNIKLPNGEVYELGGSGLDDKITNCITEIPQRIKYTLENGTLTIKAGSVVIVPYGTTDRTSEFPVGATFINDNFKVYDTQFEDGKFFVWAEVQNNISGTRTTTDTNTRFITLYVHANSVDGAINSASGTSITTSALFYNTSTNLIEYLTNGANTDGNLAAFPLGISKANGTNKFATIQQIFNGFGYIGSTVWVDKGFKGLIPNGRNADGTLNNIEFEVDELTAFNASYAKSGQYTLRFYIDKDERNKSYLICGKNLNWENKNYIFNSKPTSFDNGLSAVWMKQDTNEIFKTFDGGSTYFRLNAYACCEVTFGTTQVTSFNPKQAFRAVDYNDIVGLRAYIVETYKNGASWYRVWSDGWVEQGGKYDNGSLAYDFSTTITLPIKMANETYTAVATASRNNASAANRAGVTNIFKQTTTQLGLGWYRGNNTTETMQYINWQVSGYKA